MVTSKRILFTVALIAYILVCKECIYVLSSTQNNAKAAYNNESSSSSRCSCCNGWGVTVTGCRCCGRIDYSYISGGGGGGGYSGGGSSGSGGSDYTGGGGYIGGGGSSAYDNTYIIFDTENYNPLIGSENKFTINVRGNYSSIIKYSIDVSSSCGMQGTVVAKSHNLSSTLTEDIRAFNGTRKTYTATVKYYQGGIERVKVASFVVYERFPNRQELMDEFAAKMFSQWQQTKNYCATNNSQTEYYTTMYLNTEYDMSDANEAEFAWKLIDEGKSGDFSCGQRATFTNQVEERYSGRINGGGKFLVGQFHTHPPLSVCNNSHTLYSRGVGASEDVDLANTQGVPCFVYDYVGSNGRINMYHGINDAAQIYNYGTETRDYR